MRVLVLSNLYPPDVIGGYELGCKQAVDGLVERGHEVRVVTSTPRRASPTTAEPRVSRRLHLSDLWYNATRPHSHPVVNKVWDVDANWVSSHNVHVLLQEIDAFQPDVVYVWMILGVGGLGLMACLRHLRLPWVWHLMDEVPAQLCSSNWEVVVPLARSFDRFIKGRYLACSQSLVDRIERKGIGLGGAVEIVPNWIVGERPEPRDDFYATGRTLRVISAGRVTTDKGVPILIEAARLLRDRGIEDFEIDVYGPIIEPAIARLPGRHGLEGHVRILGPRPHSELIDMYGEYDLFAFPTEPREPFGFAPLEAAARGCVPLMNQVCGIGEWLVHGVHCLKTARSPEAFANAIESVILCRVDLRPIGRRAQAVVWRDFHRDAIMPTIERSLALAANASRDGAGTPGEAHRMALIAERLSHAIVQEPFLV